MKLIRLDTTDSTNTRTFQYLTRFDPVIVIANTQNSGRGREGNSWESPRGNIYLSVGKTLNTRTLPGLSVRIAIHVVSRLNSLLKGEKLRIKWPNDIYFYDKKAGGILVESKITAETARIAAGIGLNIAVSPLENAACLPELSALPLENVEQFLVEAILTAFSDMDNTALLNKLRDLSWFQIGDTVRFSEGGSPVDAVFDGYSNKLAMMIQTGNKKRPVLASEVSKIRKSPLKEK